MELRSCRDCVNFEDRRDIDNIALCKKREGPYVCCEQFNPKPEFVNKKGLYHMFCSECLNFEEIGGIPVCARNHTPGVACGEFSDRFGKLKVMRQNRHMKAALISYAILKSSNNKVPDSLIDISRRIKW